MLSITLVQALLFIISVRLSFSKPIYPRFTVGQEHFEVISMRQSTEVNPNAVDDVVCVDRNQNIVFHDQNVAELAICDGIAGSTTKCSGAPESTVGQSGSAKFSLKATTPGATINISKERWEQCVRAARAVCPTGSMKGICLGGASSGDVEFVLDTPWSSEL